HFGCYPYRFHYFLVCSSGSFTTLGMGLNTVRTLGDMRHSNRNKLFSLFIEITLFKHFFTEFSPCFYFLLCVIIFLFCSFFYLLPFFTLFLFCPFICCRP